MSDVEHHHRPVVAAYRQQGVVYWVEVEAHNLFQKRKMPQKQGHGMTSTIYAHVREIGEREGMAIHLELRSARLITCVSTMVVWRLRLQYEEMQRWHRSVC